MVAQRVLANQPARQVHIDMGAGGEGRQQLTIDTHQFVAADIEGFVVSRRDLDFDHDRCSTCCG
ncbi:hypothetical protein D3C84_1206830 [compost metagenome]